VILTFYVGDKIVKQFVESDAAGAFLDLLSISWNGVDDYVSVSFADEAHNGGRAPVFTAQYRKDAVTIGEHDPSYNFFDRMDIK
jgi:hypothetical protein